MDREISYFNYNSKHYNKCKSVLKRNELINVWTYKDNIANFVCFGKTLLGTFCWLVRGSLFIELGYLRDLGKGWRGDLGTFMISRPI